MKNVVDSSRCNIGSTKMINARSNDVAGHKRRYAASVRSSLRVLSMREDEKSRYLLRLQDRTDLLSPEFVEALK
ncbi:hypothetical protein WJX75_000729 [Coccomyxa subellipsoidea]|uniref:Uncharacterized protein n=1 Tax=Coccomyxa subellipsoidea TaxID=248742 RepID=A0ABR2YSF1_9CHLO